MVRDKLRQPRITLKDLRSRVGRTQRDIADLTGKTGKTISEYERGLYEPRLTPAETQRFLVAYDCTLQELIAAVAEALSSRQQRED